MAIQRYRLCGERVHHVFRELHKHVLDGGDSGGAVLDCDRQACQTHGKCACSRLRRPRMHFGGVVLGMYAARGLVALLDGESAHVVLGRVCRALAICHHIYRGRVRVRLSSAAEPNRLLDRSTRALRQQVLSQKDPHHQTSSDHLRVIFFVLLFVRVVLDVRQKQSSKWQHARTVLQIAEDYSHDGHLHM